MSLTDIIHTAAGRGPADLLLANARILNVFNGEIVRDSIAVKNGTIVGIGDYAAGKTVDLDGRFVLPGFIDPHVHIESAMTSVTEFARAVAVRGTTTVIADPHEIANVLGTAGLEYMLAAAIDQPIHIYYTLSSCVPATDLETAGARLCAADLAPLLAHEKVLGLAEMMNFPGVIAADPAVLKKIELAKEVRKPIDGHAPGLSGKALNAYLCTGIASDHECTTAEEAREKLAAGMHIMIREGTGAKNLEDLFPVIDARTYRRMMWCTDDRHPHDLLAEGGIDFIVRRAIAKGLDPITAVIMATLIPADYFGLKDAGAIAPGRQADLLVVDDLNALTIGQVYSAGKKIAEKGRLRPDIRRPSPVPIPPSMHITPTELDFTIRAEGSRMRVIEIIPDQIVTTEKICETRAREGLALADPGRDLLKIAVINRHTRAVSVGKGFVHGMGLKNGAIASSVAHDSHNIVIVGVVDQDMKAAATEVAKMQGGLVVVSDGTVRAALPLPIGGLMSADPLQAVCAGLDRLLGAARSLGTCLKDPFMSLSFLALPVIPSLKITDKGLVDVDRFQIVPLFVP